MTFNPLTPEQRKQAKPYGIKLMIEATKEQLKVYKYEAWIKDLQEDLRYLEDLLEEIEGRTQA